MSDEIRLLSAFALALVGAQITVPLALRLARRTAFFDKPDVDKPDVDKPEGDKRRGYKVHGGPTPYLGGAGVMAAFAVPALALGGGASEYSAIVLGALVLLLVGTVDDRIEIGPLPRVLAELAVAAVLWKSGLGWSVFDSEAVNLLLTLVWIVGIVNAFNLMDNMDGAAGCVAAVSATGVAVLALIQGHPMLAALLLALVGACAGFLPYNLASPSRIFLGDGGSMPIGFVIGAGVMVVGSHEGTGLAAVLAAAPLVGLPILDTTLVIISRHRQGLQILSGNQDHLTHRLRDRVGCSARRVGAVLAGGQAALCLAAVAMFTLGTGAVIGGTVSYLISGAMAIWMLETPGGILKTRPVDSERSREGGGDDGDEDESEDRRQDDGDKDESEDRGPEQVLARALR